MIDSSRISWLPSQKGAVTTYIILGLVILIVGGVAVYVFTQFERSAQEEERAYLAQLPDEVQAPLLFVDSCIRQTARQGLERMGQHSGWVSVDDPTLAGKSFSFGYFSTEYEGVAFSQDKDAIKLPYWYYLASPSDCTSCSFSGNIPTLQEMETMLAKYVERELPSCINNFDSLSDQYTIEQLANASADVSIRNENVEVNVDYPLRIQLEDSTFTYQKFPITLSVNLKRIYELATKITEAEAQHNFLERYILTLLSAYTAVDAQSLPPISAQEFGPRQVFWSTYDVKNRLQSIIRDNLLYLTIPGTGNFYPLTLDEDEPNRELKQGYYYGSVINILQDNTDLEGIYDSIDSNFFYLDWPYYFDISPSQGALIRPEKTAGDLNFLQIFSQSYEFYYDFAFPVYVDLRDQDAFNGEGYSFLFALEANVKNNQPFAAGASYSIVPSQTSFSLFSDPKQRISGIITVKAIEKARDDEDKPILGASVSYQCAGNTAYIGTTNNEGVLAARFPICQGGVLKLTKEGYYGTNLQLDTQVAVDDDIAGRLSKIYEKKVELKVRKPDYLKQVQSVDYGALSFDQYRQLLQQGQEDLNNSEAYVTVTRVKESPFDDEFSRFVYFDPKNKNQVQTIELIPGEYIVNIQYLDLEGVSVAEDTREFDVPDKNTLGLTSDTERVTLPAINMTPAPLGGGIMDADTAGYWRVSRQDLQQDEGVRFYALVQEKPQKHEDLASLGDVVGLSTRYASLLEPYWIKID